MKQPSYKTGDGRDPTMLDPDVRFLLANERTLLAWARTGLALVAGGLALTQLGRGIMVQIGLGLSAIVLGAGMSILGYVRYRAADRDIRLARLPAMGRGPIIQVVAIVGFALAAVFIELVYTW